MAIKYIGIIIISIIHSIIPTRNISSSKILLFLLFNNVKVIHFKTETFPLECVIISLLLILCIPGKFEQSYALDSNMINYIRILYRISSFTMSSCIALYQYCRLLLLYLSSR